MNRISYKYKHPEHDLGMKRVKIPKRLLQEILLNRPKLASIWHSPEAYYDENMVRIEFHASLPMKIVTCLLFPITIFFYGIVNYKDVISETKGVLSRKHGAFPSECIFRKSKLYDKIVRIPRRPPIAP